MITKKETTCGNGRMKEPSVLFHADANDPDMLYFSRFQATDPYLAFSVNGRRIPRHTDSGYWGDMTRTYLKGRASDAQRRLARTVRKTLQGGDPVIGDEKIKL